MTTPLEALTLTELMERYKSANGRMLGCVSYEDMSPEEVVADYWMVRDELVKRGTLSQVGEGVWDKEHSK